jgi:pheromone a factor receptor
MTIYTFYKREHRFRQMMSSSNGFSRGRYLRLMALSATEILGTIPLATYFIVTNAKAGVRPWTSWADIHSHYSAIEQVAGFIWKNDPLSVKGLEMFRWLLVACAFIFFALIGIADEARQHYRDVYTSLASRIGYLTSTLQGSSHVCVVHSLCWPPRDSLGLAFFLQYFVNPSHEK